MPSLFPGMDPYLEDAAFWSDFHSRFINAWAEAIAEQLPDEYEASLGERVYLAEADPETRKLIYADVGIAHADDLETPSPAAVPAGTAVMPMQPVTMQPVTIPLQIIGGPRQLYVEILQRPERTLVAVLELLSPANKQEPGRTEYLSKRQALLHQHVHLVELDLLLGGRRLPLARSLPTADYYYLLSRAERRPDCEVYAWDLAQPLAALPVPLRAAHADRLIDLGRVFSTSFDRGRYGRRLRYRQPCPAPLRPDQRAWAASVVAAHTPP